MNKSPFPGMDPYLEIYWRDVHHRLVTYSCDLIQGRLPDDLMARMDERVFLESDIDVKEIYPDVEVVETPTSSRGSVATEGGTATMEVAQPVMLDAWIRDSAPQAYVEIIDTRSGNRVITVIEFLSPSNKTTGRGRELYLAKQRGVIEAESALVEIDLTRSGVRDTMFATEQLPPELRQTYQALIRRPWIPRRIALFAIALRERLPTIPIPLRETDPEVALDLQALIDQCYVNGRYHKIDYTQPLATPLDEADAKWMDELLRVAKRR